MSGRSLPMQWAERRAAELRRVAGEARRAYTKPYMKEPCVWLASVYDEAAALIDKRVAEARASGAFEEESKAVPAQGNV